MCIEDIACNISVVFWDTVYNVNGQITFINDDQLILAEIHSLS